MQLFTKLNDLFLVAGKGQQILMVTVRTAYTGESIGQPETVAHHIGDYLAVKAVAFRESGVGRSRPLGWYYASGS